MAYDASEAMERVVTELRKGFHDIDIDVQKEMVDEWTRKNATILVSIVEPEDTRYFDIGTFGEDLKARIVELCGAPIVTKLERTSSTSRYVALRWLKEPPVNIMGKPMLVIYDRLYRWELGLELFFVTEKEASHFLRDETRRRAVKKRAAKKRASS